MLTHLMNEWMNCLFFVFSTITIINDNYLSDNIQNFIQLKRSGLEAP